MTSSIEEKTLWRIQLERQYALICKNCHSKVLDPCKGNVNQIFTKARCPVCGFSKEHDKQTNASNKQLVKLRVAI